MDDVYVKTVIELPVSYGCMGHCKFCASSLIKEFECLKPEQLQTMLFAICQDKNLSEDSEIVLSMTGIGDMYFNYENVLLFFDWLKNFTHIKLNVSSCFWNKSSLQRIEDNLDKWYIRILQITYISDNRDKTQEIIPEYNKKTFDFSEIVDFISKSKQNYFRINYVLIKGVNDSIEDFKRFASKVRGIRDKVVIRISKLNETCATRKYGLQPVDLDSMYNFEEMLSQAGIKSYKFWSSKNDDMNCGQLITEKNIF